MPTQAEVIAELYRRDALPPDRKSAYEELMRRGAVPQVGLHEALQPIEQQLQDEAKSQATGDIMHREQGMTLEKTDNGDGTATYTPTQTQAPQNLSTREQLAIYRAHAADKQFGQYVGDQLGRAGQPLPSQIEEAQNAESFARVKARRVAGQTGITNFSNATVGGLLQIGPDALEMTKPMEGDSVTAQLHNAILNHLLPGMDSPEAQQLRDRVRRGASQMESDTFTVDPESTAGKFGHVVSGVGRYAVPGVGAAADAGAYRRHVEEARRKGTPISPEEELTGAAAIFGSTLAMGKLVPGKTAAMSYITNNQAFKNSLTQAVGKYALGAGYAYTDMQVMNSIHNAVEHFTTDPDRYLTEGNLGAGATGALLHGVAELPGFAKDAAAGARGEGVESRLRPLADQKQQADQILRSGEHLSPEIQAHLQKLSDHNPAITQEVLDRVEKQHGSDAMESLLERLQKPADTEEHGTQPASGLPVVPRVTPADGAVDNTGSGVGPKAESKAETPTQEVARPKFRNIHSDLAVPPAELKDEVSITKFAKENGYDATRLEGKDGRRMLIELADQRSGRLGKTPSAPDQVRFPGERQFVPEKPVDRMPSETPGGKKILPEPPKEAPDMDFPVLKKWAKENGYERIDGIEGRRALTREMAKQRRNSKTDLPELPASSKNWNDNQARYWAEQSGYKVEEGMTAAEVKAAVRDQHKATSTSRPDAAKLDALNSVVESRKAADKSIADAPKKTPWYGPSLEFLKDVGLDVGERIRDLSPRVYGKLMTSLETHPRQRISATRAKLVPVLRDIQGEIGKVGSARDEQFKSLWHDQNWEGMKAMLPKMGEKLEAVRPVLADLHAREVKLGIREGTLGENYLPSSVRDLEMLRSLHPDRMSEIEEAWHLSQRAQGGKALNAEEKMVLANNVLAGYGPKPAGGNRPGFAKARTRGTLTPQELAAYEHPFTALMHRVERGERAIGKAEVFGKAGVKNPEVLAESVGAYIKKEVEAGTLDGGKEKEVTSLIHTLMAGYANQPGKMVRQVRALVHLTTLGHLTSGVRQLTDLATTVRRHGVFNTIGAVGDALRLTDADKPMFLRQLGLDPVSHDFVDPGRIGTAVDTVTKWNGFQKVDVFTKEVEINAFRRKLETAATSPDSAAFRKIARDWEPVMGGKDFAAATEAARNGDFTNQHLRDLSAMVLADVQPITMMQMPRKYLESKDGRAFYVLRSFQLKQLASIRRDIVQRLSTKGQRMEGGKQLAGLLAFGVAANFGMRFMEDLVNGKDLSNADVPDRVLDAGLNIIGTNRFTATKVRQGGPLSALQDLAFEVPGLGNFDAPVKDAVSMGNGKGFETFKLVPVPLVSDLLYYWSPWGRGYTKNQEDAKHEYQGMLKDAKDRAKAEYQDGNDQAGDTWLALYNDRRLQGPGDGRKHALAAYDLKHTIERALEKERANGTH